LLQPPRLKGYLKHKLYLPLLSLLQQGITPKKLAVTTAMGAVLGIMPLLGVSTIIGTSLALRLRLNVPLLVLVSYLMYPIQILLYIPFIRLGLNIFDIDELRFSLAEMIQMFQLDWFMALRKLWLANLIGVLAWLLLCLPVFGVLYGGLLPLFKKFSRTKPVPVGAGDPSAGEEWVSRP
jgi:uncharacterized protein (DUF2062 family)